MPYKDALVEQRLAILRRIQQNKKRFITMREIVDAIGLSSKSVAHYFMNDLLDRGLVEKTDDNHYHILEAQDETV